jgi:SAM-dependent methyltransferase
MARATRHATKRARHSGSSSTVRGRAGSRAGSSKKKQIVKLGPFREVKGKRALRLSSIVGQILPDHVRDSVRFAQYSLSVLGHLRGTFPRVCNLCHYNGKFRSFGHPPRSDACCPQCNSLERHRLFKLWLDRRADFVCRAEILHFAPEKELANLLKATAQGYVSADIEGGRSDRVLDIEAMEVSDDAYDCIVCSHVLEHVDDRKALAEMHRVLRPGGLAVVMVPVVEGWARTIENEAGMTEAERRLYFGQRDHVRLYGFDIRDRIRAAGFALEEFTAMEPEVSRYGLIRGEKLFVARKPE